MKSPKEIAITALADVEAHEQEHEPSYWVGYLLATLERIAEQR
jgi:hypothetical protein